MPAAEVLQKAEQEMTICNACRYCEGFCAVFPAMELRTTFTKGDLLHLANLCFDCRACYYACQFAPPHEFAVNIPKIFSDLRVDTYQDYAWPRVFSKMVKDNARAVRFYERNGFAHAGDDVNPTSGRPVLKMAWRP